MKQYNIAIEGVEGGVFTQGDSDTVLRAALRAGIGFPYECNSGGCGSCKCEVVSGEVENLWPEAPAITERDRRKGRLLACQCRARTDLRIRMRPQAEAKPMIPPKRMRARLAEVREITHDIREFRFRTAEPATFLPGQYAMLAIPGVSSPRAYSMSNLARAAEGGEWHLQIRRVPHGKATEVLFHHLHPGDEVELDGPYGMAYLRQDVSRDIVCVAGGSGLAPMVSIARGASQAGMLRQRHLHFFYGARTPRDVCGESFLRELPEFGDRIHFHPVVSLPADEAALWSGETGFVHELVRRTLSDRMAEFEFYFAGPPPMTNALHEMLMVGYRVPFAQIHFDRFF
ncbi:2Fe-2S iron-sulfur cluster-binding protein [Nevskia soli]|uniref:2Fe-2S iron-sulfur cluster-binding protein n=1 Tax=Nevskia soli TaxID=418856 RepID=UPI0004A70DD5|nr:2Fe-2S iron-sulfur cluster-binding protein [Nevskia soli]